MNILDIAISCGVAPKKVSSSKGGEYASGCPMCGGNDRFRIWPEKGEYGKWWCRGCGKGGDSIQLLKEAKGMSFKEACEYLGRELPKKERNRTPRAPKKAVNDWQPRETLTPAELWRQKAAAFADAMHTELLKNKEQLAWLAARGITLETVKRFQLGWNSTNLWRDKKSWGVEENGKKLWLPMGLVIPYSTGEDFHRLRIRRPEGEPRYYVIPGSGAAPMKIGPDSLTSKGGGAWIIVESELDAILIAQAAGDLVGVAALGSVAIKPDTTLHARLSAADLILNALDYDVAAAKMKEWWEDNFPQADRWPVPAGKDPGDYYKSGGDIRKWIITGLPLGLRPYAAPAPPKPETIEVKSETIEVKSETIEVPAETPVSTPSPSTGEGRGEGGTEDDPCAHLTRRAIIPCTRCGAKFEVRFAPGHKPLGLCFKCIPPSPWAGVL